MQHDSLQIDDFFRIAVAPDNVQDSTVLVIAVDTVTSFPDQPDFELLPLNLGPVGLAYRVQTAHPSLIENENIWVDFDLALLSNPEYPSLSIGRHDSYLGIWVKEPAQLSNNHFSTTVNHLGRFILLNCQDSKPPILELHFEGQHSFISQRPNISIITEDENGIRFLPDGVQISLDDTELDFEILGVPDTLSGANYIAAQFRPELDWGQHVLKVSVQDAAGNVTTAENSFIVSDVLKIYDYGNYPNPFKERTVFVYEVTQRVEDLKIKIYAASGRLIRSLDQNSLFSAGFDLNASGYHEIMWDGLDDDGNFIANGVYFYKIEARQGKKRIHSVGKLAKAR
jgi:hypothetical protein